MRRTAFAEEPGTTLIALGGTPGKVYEVGGWELWAPINPLYEAGDYAGPPTGRVTSPRPTPRCRC